MKPRHPERVSGPILLLRPKLDPAGSGLGAQLVLNQVQHDLAGGFVPGC